LAPRLLRGIEQMDFDSFEQLRQTTLDGVINKGVLLTISTCWKNNITQKRQ
jgi:hypothetical protein